MTEQALRAAEFFIVMFVCCVCYFPMNSFRLEYKKSCIYYIVFMVALTLINVIFMLGTSTELFSRCILFTIGLPALVFVLLISKGALSQRMFNFWLWCNVANMGRMFGQLFEYFFPNHPIIRLAGMLLFFVLFFACYQRYIRKWHHEILETAKINWFIMSLIPVAFIFMYRLICVYPKPLYENPENIPVALLLHALMILVYILMFYTFKITETSMQKEREYDNLKSQITLQKRQYEFVREKSEMDRVFRHDLRHRNTLAISYIENDDFEGLKKLLRDELRVAAEQTDRIYVKNAVVNAVLSEYIIGCEARGINVEADIEMPDELSCDENEFAVMLANILENAAENADTYVKIVVKQLNHQLCVNVRNDFAGARSKDKDGNLISTKESPSGIGMKSIQTVLDKYGGFMKTDITNNAFDLSATLKNQSAIGCDVGR